MTCKYTHANIVKSKVAGPFVVTGQRDPTKSPTTKILTCTSQIIFNQLSKLKFK